MTTLMRFIGCQTRSCVNITIMNDTQDELDEETFNITLERVFTLGSRITLDFIYGVITITDDDNGRVTRYVYQALILSCIFIVVHSYKFTLVPVTTG